MVKRSGVQISEPEIYDFNKIFKKARALQDIKDIIKNLRITLKNIKEIQNLMQKRQTDPADLNKKVPISISKPPVSKRDILNINKLAKTFKKMILSIIIRLEKMDRLLKSVVNQNRFYK